VSRALNAKVACVLAALAFVGVFRVQAGAKESASTQSAAPLTASKANALRDDAEAATPASRAAAVRLAQVAALPRLHREPRAKVAARRRAERLAERRAERRAAARRRAAAAARRREAAAAPPPVVTAPRVVAPAPAAPRPAPARPRTYVGENFDSEG
jgi:hypothetical protein